MRRDQENQELSGEEFAEEPASAEGGEGEGLAIIRRSGGRPTLGARLSPRELEVLTLSLDGKSTQEVAETLSISKRTVDFHLSNVYKKLGVRNKLQAFHRARQLGLVQFP